jgi:rhodanese-related sulfurtransferase
MKQGGPGRIVTPFGFTMLVLLGAISVALWLAYLPWRWERTKDELRRRFPDIRHIDAKGLTDWISQTKDPQPAVIDVRPQADYDFSHLPHALHMAVSDTPASLGFTEKTDRTIVVYDAVGEDAFPVADSLGKRGYERVRVLEGGIFEWANRGLPLEGASGATGAVRAEKSKFAGLLKSRATAP